MNAPLHAGTALMEYILDMFSTFTRGYSEQRESLMYRGGVVSFEESCHAIPIDPSRLFFFMLLLS
jgi:hypothetical protein